MISTTHNLMTYIVLVVTATYILSVGSVYAQQRNQTNQTGQTVQDIKTEAIYSAIESAKGQAGI